MQHLPYILRNNPCHNPTARVRPRGRTRSCFVPIRTVTHQNAEALVTAGNFGVNGRKLPPVCATDQ